MRNLFTYGTLMVPVVMAAVTGRTFRFEQAVLPGYARFRIKRQVYPGIIADATGSVHGLMYHAIDEQCLQRLDEFESHIYQRRQVRVQLTGADNTDAYAYIVARNYQHLLSGDDWDPEDFKRRHLQTYLSAL